MLLQGGHDRDPVMFSYAAPQIVKPGTPFDLQVVAYPRKARDAVWHEAFLEEAAEAGRPKVMPIAKGTWLMVQLVRKLARKKHSYAVVVPRWHRQLKYVGYHAKQTRKRRFQYAFGGVRFCNSRDPQFRRMQVRGIPTR